jgi:alpha-beta hydrolase superfamily lysophospholipase
VAHNNTAENLLKLSLVQRKRALKRLTEAAAGPLLIGGAAVMALDAARRIFRRMQLFCPTRDPLISWNPEDYGVPAGAAEELWIETDDGEYLYGWYCRAKNPIASTLYFHGNTGNLTNTAFTIPHLLEGGINVLYFDYRGFGRSTGTPSFNGIVDDGIAAARMHEKIRPKNVPSIIYGYSLGGSIAAQVIRRYGFDGMVLQSTFTCLPDIARVAFPRFPLHLVSGRLFDTHAVVKKLHIPVLIIHGASDEVCPAWMAHQLYDSCSSERKELVMIDSGLHKDLWVREPATLVREIQRFIDGLPAEPHEIEAPPSAIDLAIDAAFRSLRRLIRRHPAHQPL